MEACTQQQNVMPAFLTPNSDLRGAKLILSSQIQPGEFPEDPASSEEQTSSYTSPVPLPAVVKAQRTRRAHNKVRTGCLTCKIRRKKCDETKPACTRCVSTGRTCDGYPGHSSGLARDDTVSTPEASTTKALPVPSLFSRSAVARFALLTPVSSPDNADFDEVIPRTHIPGAPQHNFRSSWSTPSSVLTPASTTTPETDDTEIDAFILDYPTSPKRRKRDTPASAFDSLILPRAPNSFTNFGMKGKISSLEAHCFSLFRHRTGPQFAAYFDSSLWRNYSPQLALSNPTLFAAATALGAAHRRFQLGISREAFEYCAHAERLHKRALAMLDSLKSQSHLQPSSRNQLTSATTPETGTAYSMAASPRDIIMSTELLLGLFNAFQSNWALAVSHINAGISHLVNRPMRLLHSTTTNTASTITAHDPSTFTEFFKRIHARANVLFGTPHTILETFSLGGQLPPMPTVFSSFEEARDLIFTEADWIMRTPACIWRVPGLRAYAQKIHVSRFLKWGVAYANTCEAMERTDQEKRACILLKLCKDAACLLLYLTLYVYVDEEVREREGEDLDLIDPWFRRGGGDDEAEDWARLREMSNGQESHDGSAYDEELAYATKSLWATISRREELLTNLARVHILGETILDESSPFHYVEHSASFDSAIGPPRNSTLEPESSGKTRHMVKSLMKRRRRDDDDDWNWLDVYGIAERLSAIEEHAVIGAARNMIPQEIDPRWVDITCLMESRRLLLRYCYPGDDDLGMRWTQQWWAF